MVEDQGSGIRQRSDHGPLFEPFFTTKQPGQERRLGLATSTRLSKSTYGQILRWDSPVDSLSKRGTRFTVTLRATGVFESPVRCA